MTRVRRGYIARKHRKKICLSHQGAHLELTQTIAQQERRALTMIGKREIFVVCGSLE